MADQPTKFVKYDTQDTKESNALNLNEPILASFQERIPPADSLKKMRFTIYQQDLKSEFQSKNRRVIKSSRKNVNYTASNFANKVADKDQSCDYYLGVISDKHDGKVFMVPVATSYQFT